MLIFVVARMRLDRYEELRRRFEVRVGGARESTGGSEPLVGRLGFVKTAVHTGPRAGLTASFWTGWKNVHVQPGEVVNAGKLRIGRFGGEAIIADELADDGSVLLLDVGTVVLLPGAAARKSDALAPTVAACRFGNTLRR